MGERMLVIGARPGSLGEAIAEGALSSGLAVTRAGVSEEQLRMDVRSRKEIEGVMFYGYPAVVCTAGVNIPSAFGSDTFNESMKEQMVVNAIGPLYALHCWIRYWTDRGIQDLPMPNMPLHFVMVSSNSAQIARTGSGPYCASKAALSMGVRCAARENAELPLNIWGVEPGWIDGTPMSEAVAHRFGGQPLHRIPGNRTVDPFKLADFIVEELSLDQGRFAGQMVRMDGGEQ